jgi:hypothetical protein
MIENLVLNEFEMDIEILLLRTSIIYAHDPAACAAFRPAIYLATSAMRHRHVLFTTCSIYK